MRILITGSSGGIAYDLALRLTKRGHLVYLTTHTMEELKRLKKKIEEQHLKILCFKMDITKEEDIKLVEKLEIDCLVSHAGIGIGGSVLEMPIDALRKNYEVNVFASFNLIQKIYQKWKKDEKPGKIFVTGSLASMLPIPYLGSYTSTKSSIAMLAYTLKKELPDLSKNITISLIEPGAYKTGFNQVMIENIEKYSYKSSGIYQHREQINTKLRNLFNLIESKNISSLTKKVVKQIESSKPKFRISRPLMQRIFTKIYLIFYR